MLLRIPEVYALIIIVGTLGYLFNSGFVRLEKRMFFWGGST
jgi:ABC-type nitrate/sulfonate/bicarbonate transport system permease component